MYEHKFYEKPLVYAAKHIDDSERLKSQSGGMFAAISDVVLQDGGVIYGCILNDSFEAVHARTESKAGRDAMRYSKYVQSNMGDCFLKVYEDLKRGKKVLFSGTSCQIAGLQGFLKMKKDVSDTELYTVDIVCHGVPSPRVWRDYLAWEERKKRSRIRNVICRNKVRYGWKSHVVTITWDKGRPVNSRVFPKLFYSHVILRPACYRCPYKDIIHPADITVADYWGIDKALPGFKDDKGVSLVLVNTDKGKELFKRCSGSLIIKKTKLEDSMQQPLIAPYDPPDNRQQFWKDYRSGDFKAVAVKYGEYSVYKITKWKFRYWIRRTFGI